MKFCVAQELKLNLKLLVLQEKMLFVVHASKQKQLQNNQFGVHVFKLNLKLIFGDAIIAFDCLFINHVDLKWKGIIVNLSFFKVRPIVRHWWYFRFIFIFFQNCSPSILFNLIDLLEEWPFFCILGFPWSWFDKSKFIHFLMLHQSAFHSALQIFNLIIPTAFGKQLMAHYALWVFLSLLVALMEMIKRKRTTIRSLCLGSHYN